MGISIKLLMAKQNSTVSAFQGIMADLRKGNIKPIYLLIGEEAYFIDKISEYITDNVLREEERDFNQVVFYGADTSMRQVLEQARRYPMMAERQVVVLREAQQAKEFALIEKYAEKIVDTTVLVICARGMKVDRRKKYFNLVAQKGVLFVSEPMHDYDIVPFAEEQVRVAGATIDRKASSMLVEAVGTDVKRLMSELAKVLAAFPPGAPKNITPEMVEKFVGISNEFNGFELRDAVAQRDVYKTNLIVTHLMKKSKSDGLFKILPSVFSYFQNLMIAHYAPPPKDVSAIMSYLGINHPLAAKPYVEGVRNYSAMKTIQIIDKFHEIDCKLKGLDSNNTPEEELAQELFFFILH